MASHREEPPTAKESNATMRIISGIWRSRRLVRPDVATTRPIPDRVRESIFSQLGHLLGEPGALPALAVADVFAGSGGLGLEALSRGAVRCVFFERGRAAKAVLQKNIELLGARDRSRVVSADAWRSLPAVHEMDRFGIVFLDPPYRDARDEGAEGCVGKLLGGIARSAPVDLPLVVLHHEQAVTYDANRFGGEWIVLDRRRFGTGAVTIFGSAHGKAPQGPSAAAGEERERASGGGEDSA